MRNWQITGKSLACAAALAIGVTVAGPAAHAKLTVEEPPGRAVPVAESQRTTMNSDTEVLQFLLGLQGPIAEAKPEVARAVGVKPADLPHPRLLGILIEEYLKWDGDFHETVTVPLHAGDPLRAEAALEHFGNSFEEYVTSSSGEQSIMRMEATGIMEPNTIWNKQTLLVVTTAVGAWQALGFHTVAGFMTVTALTVIIHVYLDDAGVTGASLEQDKLTHSIYEAFN